ncbi:uncharacterized protein LOC121792445 [Salvia splendens]|uniref:uncharacterized protein LOC121792445 n=1 Tax=Salvia splendens TaxID=180675 RepID=UPI001C25DFEE|nr:uncharacterized protein LOC121792445 [Salvia splendens]
MADNGGLDYFRLPSFFKKFSEDHSMDELRVRLLRIASRCHFHNGWAEFRLYNRIVHSDVLTFTLVDVGVFHVKRYKPNSGFPPLSDLQVVEDEDSDPSYSLDVDTSDDYEPSDTEIDTSDDDGYVSDAGALDEDGCPTFVVTLTPANIKRTLEISFPFWQWYIKLTLRIYLEQYQAVEDEDSDQSYSLNVDTSDDYEPSDAEIDTSDYDGYVSDAGALDEDGCPTFIVTLTPANIKRTLEIPFPFLAMVHSNDSPSGSSVLQCGRRLLVSDDGS